METTPMRPWGTMDKFWEVFTRIAAALFLAAGAWIIGHEVRLSAIEGNRFTSRDAYEMERRLTDRFSRRPEWLSAEMSEIKTLLREFDQKFETHLINHVIHNDKKK